MSSEIAIKAEGLGKAYLIYRKPQDRLKQMVLRWRRYYQEYWAVQNVDLSIKRGEAVGIIGRNGSGKSTLLQMIAGTLQANSGSITVDGRVAPLLELGAGFNPEFTGRENIRLAAAVMGLTTAQIHERQDAIIDFAGIGDFIDQPVKTYSSGMYARLAFAVAAHVDADILIVDEILAVGDAAFTQKCMRFIRKFKETGTLLFVSHDAGSINSLCDRAIWMDKGQVRAEGPAKEVSFLYQASVHEGADDSSFTIAGRRREEPKRVQRDFRHEMISNSDKRNVIEVFEFDPNAPSYGKQGATVESVRILDLGGQEIPVLEGGEDVMIEVDCAVVERLESPIIGFLLRDRLGQNLFGDNTYLTHRSEPVPVSPGDRIRARFQFHMPYLPTGDYAIGVAIADGDNESHHIQHWVDDAILFRVHSAHVTYGLMGIPMQNISLERVDRTE